MNITLSLTKKQQHLVVTMIEFEDGFETSRKVGIVGIDPAYDPEELLEKSKEYEWQLVGEKNAAGFYDVKRGKRIEA